MDSLLIDRCKIQTRTGTTNSFGEKTYSYADTYTNVPCRFYQPSLKFVGGMDRLDAGEFVRKLPKIFLKKTQTIVEQNRVVGTTGFTDTYSVENIKNVYDSVSLHHKEISLQKVV